MALEDVPAAAQELGYRAVEIDDAHLLQRAAAWRLRHPRFRDYTTARLLRLHAAFERAGTRLVAWTAHTDFTLTERAARWQLHYLEGAIATANDFGARLVCIRAGGSEDPTQDEMLRCLSGLRAAAQLAERFRTRLALENGLGITQSVERTAQLLREINSPYLGACLRFDAEDSVALAPFAIHAHALSHAFDSQGRETTADYPACMAALRDANFNGWISIQYEGDAEPAFGIVQTAELISALASS